MLFVGLWKADWTRVHWVACPHPIPQTHSQPLHSMHLMRKLGNIWMATHQCPYFWHLGSPGLPLRLPLQSEISLVLKSMVQRESFTSFDAHRTAGLQVSCCTYRICYQVVLGQLHEQQVSMHSAPPPPSPGWLLIFKFILNVTSWTGLPWYS